MVRHWTPKPVIISCIRSSPSGDNSFFAVVKSFEYNNAISANFVQVVKNSIEFLIYIIESYITKFYEEGLNSSKFNAQLF